MDLTDASAPSAIILPSPAEPKRLTSRTADVVVAGGGPTGFAVALGLAKAGLDVAVVAGRQTAVDDGRTAAVFEGNVAYLAGFGLGDALEAMGAPLRAIRLIDATGGLLQAPTVTFTAGEIGHDRFGLNLPTAPLTHLLQRAAERAGARILPAMVTGFESTGSHGTLLLDDGTHIRAPLVVAADGQRSLVREAAGIAVSRRSTGQTALTLKVRHTRDHDDVSTEFHTRSGPFTLVPSGDLHSSVVWMTRPAQAERLLALSDTALAEAAERQCLGMLGPFTLVGRRGSYPLQVLTAERFSTGRLALVGEAAHAFPPIGAQGLNLGLRDAIALVEAVTRAHGRGQDWGAPALLERYGLDRRRDALLRSAGVDGLNRSLTSGLLPVDAARSLGLALLGNVSPLRRLAMRIGMAEPLGALLPPLPALRLSASRERDRAGSALRQ